MSSPSPCRAAIVYDFDGTLAPGNIQEHSLIPNFLGTTKEEFWAEVGRRKRAHDVDQILVYMQLLRQYAEKRSTPLTAAVLAEHASDVPLFQGVTTWFDRINLHAQQAGLDLQHFVVSSANAEMVEGSKIARYFRRVFACKYIYDEQGAALWPGTVVNYTTKTQYLFRINKGVDSYWNDDKVNEWVPMHQRPIPFERMLYIGDGDTDIPSMKMVRHQGGNSVAVFDPAQWERGEAQKKAYKLIAEDRAHFVVPADYQEGSQLDVTVKGILGRVSRAQRRNGHL